MSDKVVAELQEPTPAVGDGGPEMVQLLTPEGERVSHPDYDQYVDDLTAEELRGFYRDLVLIRRIDAEATALQRQGELGIWAQPARPGGRAGRLRPRAAPAGLRLPDLPRARRRLVPRASTRSTCSACSAASTTAAGTRNENNFHLYTIVIGAQTLHATGYAMGMQRDGDVGTGDPDRDAAVIAYFGDGASSPGRRQRGVHLRRRPTTRPVVFFCQNNQWAISEPIERQTRIPLYQRALGFGFPGVRVDGNDVLATYAVTQAALRARPATARARRSSRPTPTGWARTPRPTTRPATALSDERRDVEAQGPDRAAQGLPHAATAWPTRSSSTTVEAEADELGAPPARGLHGAARPDAAERCSTTSTPRSTAVLARAARRLRGATSRRSRGRH